jgi:glycosyltransferase involved in cell wall biosynthesis
MTLLQTVADTAVMGAEWLNLERPRLGGAARERTGRHLALLARALPPTSSAGVYRPLSFMRYGSVRGWRIDAFSSEPPPGQRQHGDELLSRIPRETKLHVVPPSSREPSYRFFPRVDGGFTNALAYARFTIDALANDPPDAVLASGPPFFTFVAALLVARRFGVPLILDYRDEWTECPFDFVTKSGDDRAWERRCLGNADAVLFTTESHLRHQLATFPVLSSDKAHVVANGWEPDDFVDHDGDSSAAGSSDASTLRIAHVGNLSGHTPARDFLESLELLLTDVPDWRSRLRMQLIGRRSLSTDNALQAFRHPEVIDVIDHVGKREASRRMRESDVLLLLASPELERYLPGKLFDYLAARRPVLVFGARGESSALIDRLGAGVFCPSGSSEALGQALVRARTLDIARDTDAVNEWLRAHRRDELASRAFDIIESVASRK